ncbi:MAG: hypothetical protein JHC61_04840 [Burkholderiaceae bacterium]|nr:hypothetical protein [Burkholderiaceae bacterium]
MNDAQPAMFAANAPPRSKVELLYQEILRESHQLVTRLEQVTRRQEDIQQSLQALPTAIRQAGLDAAHQAADYANRCLLEASRTTAHATSDLRVASHAATSAVQAAAWRTGLLCAASAFCGSVLCAAVIALLLPR